MALVDTLEILLKAKISDFRAAMKRAESSLDQFTDRAEKMAKTLNSVGKKFSVAVTAPVTAIGAAAVKATSDLDEALNATQVAFGKSADRVIKWADALDSGFGFSRKAALEAATGFQLVTQDAGFSAEQMTKLAERAADLGSVFNRDVIEVADAMRAALVGEFEPLRRLGAVLNASEIESRALAMGLAKSKDELTTGAKQAAIYSLLMEKTAFAQGDAVRTSGTMAGQLRTVRAEYQRFAETLGRDLLPVARDSMSVLRSAIAGLRELSPETRRNVIAFAGLSAVIGPVLIVTSKFLEALVGLVKFIRGPAARALAGLAVGIAAVVGPFLLAARAVRKASNGMISFVDSVTLVVRSMLETLADAISMTVELFSRSVARLLRLAERAGRALRIPTTALTRAREAAERFSEALTRDRAARQRAFDEAVAGAMNARAEIEKLRVETERSGDKADDAARAARDWAKKFKDVGAASKKAAGGVDDVAKSAERLKERFLEAQRGAEQFAASLAGTVRTLRARIASTREELAGRKFEAALIELRSRFDEEERRILESRKAELEKLASAEKETGKNLSEERIRIEQESEAALAALRERRSQEEERLRREEEERRRAAAEARLREEIDEEKRAVEMRTAVRLQSIDARLALEREKSRGNELELAKIAEEAARNRLEVQEDVIRTLERRLKELETAEGASADIRKSIQDDLERAKLEASRRRTDLEIAQMKVVEAEERRSFEKRKEANERFLADVRKSLRENAENIERTRRDQEFSRRLTEARGGVVPEVTPEEQALRRRTAALERARRDVMRRTQEIDDPEQRRRFEETLTEIVREGTEARSRIRELERERAVESARRQSEEIRSIFEGQLFQVRDGALKFELDFDTIIDRIVQNQLEKFAEAANGMILSLFSVRDEGGGAILSLSDVGENVAGTLSSTFSRLFSNVTGGLGSLGKIVSSVLGSIGGFLGGALPGLAIAGISAGIRRLTGGEAPPARFGATTVPLNARPIFGRAARSIPRGFEEMTRAVGPAATGSGAPVVTINNNQVFQGVSTEEVQRNLKTGIVEMTERQVAAAMRQLRQRELASGRRRTG